MDLFEIIGPVMIGPSSSHTAGAARIGLAMHGLLGGKLPRDVRFELHQSFALTGSGHGTPQALLGGLLGLRPDDARIKDSFQLADQAGLRYSFSAADLRNAHPNAVLITAFTEEGTTSLQAESIGGGRIRVTAIDRLAVDFSGAEATLILLHDDRLGFLSEVTARLAGCGVNIGNMRVFRSQRSGQVATVIETDEAIPPETVAGLAGTPGMRRIAQLRLEGEG